MNRGGCCSGAEGRPEGPEGPRRGPGVASAGDGVSGVEVGDRVYGVSEFGCGVGWLVGRPSFVDPR